MYPKSVKNTLVLIYPYAGRAHILPRWISSRTILWRFEWTHRCWIRQITRMVSQYPYTLRPNGCQPQTRCVQTPWDVDWWTIIGHHRSSMNAKPNPSLDGYKVTIFGRCHASRRIATRVLPTAARYQHPIIDASHRYRLLPSIHDLGMSHNETRHQQRIWTRFLPIIRPNLSTFPWIDAIANVGNRSSKWCFHVSKWFLFFWKLSFFLDLAACRFVRFGHYIAIISIISFIILVVRLFLLLFDVCIVFIIQKICRDKTFSFNWNYSSRLSL